MSITSEPKTCSKCGGPIPVEAPEGLCPKCLLLGVSMPTEAGKGALPKGPPPTREAVAAAFPHLEILEFIGQGGMGFVFKARQPKLDRFVALKILPQSLAADPAFAERFIREGRLLARLTHPEIVAVHDFGQANGFFYLLMEYVDGVNLRQAMKVGRFTPAQALAIVPRICEALQFAHNEGILHRDIKPENILLDSKGRVKIADFGIAKLMGEPGTGTSLTDRGSALGTPHYMAPEQLEHPQDVDQRADIYSLGVVFYEMLTGELPIGRFAPPSEKSAVDPRVDEVVLRTLEKERERRTQTAGEVKTQVETIASGKAPSDPEAASSHLAPRGGIKSRQPALAVAAGLGLALILVFGLAALVWCYGKSRAGRRPDSAASGGPFTKTVVLTGATNRWIGARLDPATGLPVPPGAETPSPRADANKTQDVGVWTDATVEPGEALVALVKRPDGALEEAHSLLFVHWEADRVKTSTSLSWFFGHRYTPGFGEGDAEAAASQLRENTLDRPLTLTAGEPLELFAVTNHSGAVVAGYLKYMRSVPKPLDRGRHSAVKPQAVVHIRRCTPYVISVDYSVTLPAGYALRATASMGQVSTHFHPGSTNADYHSAWFRQLSAPSDYRDYPARMQAERKALEQQFQALLDQGPIPVVLGEPRQVFAITNKNGEVYRGFLELVAPSPGSTTTSAPRTQSAQIPQPGTTAVLTGATDSAPAPTETASAATDSRAPSQTQPGITVVLRNATNAAQWVGLETAYPLRPGETLVTLTKLPDGRMETNSANTFLSHSPTETRTSSGLSWGFPDYFGSQERESAEFQLRRNIQGKPLRLTPGEPVALFSVTNQFGDALTGYLQFQRFVPKPPGPDARVHASVTLKTPIAAFYWGAYYSANVPPGYRLLATGSPSRHETTSLHSGSGSSSWTPPKEFLASRVQDALARQLEDLAKQGPIQVLLGEPRLLFSVTNDAGEVYRGFFELVAPPADASTTSVPPKQSAHTRLTPSSRPTMQASKPVSRKLLPCSPARGLTPNSAATTRPTLDPATGMPVPAGPNSSGSPRLDPATGLPIPVGPPGTGPTTPATYDISDEARELTAKGDYEAALQRYLSYYEQTRTDHTRPPLSLALKGWVELGRKYPKARQALVEIQERDTRAFSQDQGTVELFHELAQINDALHEEEATYALFKAIERADPSLARQCFFYADELLVRRGEYELCLRCVGDVQRRYEICLGTYKVEQGIAKGMHESHEKRAQLAAERATRSLPAPPVPRIDSSVALKKSSDDRFVGQVCRFVEILVGTGGKADAEKLRDQALADLDDPRLKSAVSDAEERVRKVQASPRPALAQAAVREPIIPGPTPVNTSFSEPSASVEHWQPPLKPGQKPNLDGIRGEAKVLAEGDHYEEALQRHLWYHNHVLEYDRNQRGVRLSFVLRDWVELGRKYPKAKQALLEIRDGNTRKLVEGRGSFQLFVDAEAINEQYASEEATYALFKTVQERDPALARRCYHVVEDLLVKKGEYALCLTCLGDYQERFATIRQEWEKGRTWEDNMSRKLRKIPSRPGVPSVVPPPYYDKHFIEETRRLIEILVGTAHKTEAGKIQDQAVAALDDARLKSALSDAERNIQKHAAQTDNS